MAIVLKTKIPGPRSMALMSERQKAVARGPSHATPVFIKSARGALIEDVDGNRLIDFAAGIGVINVGHCNTRVLEAIKNQAQEFLHASINVTPYESYIRLAEKLNRVTPGDFAKKTFFVNTGAEAVENAIKIARVATNRQAVICFDHAFHGRTYMAMTLTSKYKPYKYGFGPFNPEVYRAPYPYAYRWPTGSDSTRVSDECFKEFEQLCNSRLTPAQIAAVIIEPILGEGGFVPAPREFLKKLQDFCRANGILIIADEIQSGFGRTGTMFASEQLNFTPDIITTAKGLGGGLPIAAVTGRAEIMDAPIEGGLGGTYSGNPLACATAHAVFDAFEKDDLLSKSKALGEIVQKRLMHFKENSSVVGDVRGLGPMQAMEIVKNKTTKEPNGEGCKALAKFAYEHGLITMTAGTYGNVMRLLMPLTITTDELNEGLSILESGLKTLV